ncbi:MAG TPA: fibronectin type III domain-containing protein [Chitinophagaceae bacterium]
MSKILSTLLILFFFSGLYAQNKIEIKGITVTGIKGIKRSLAEVIANERTISANYKVHLRLELEGPKPIGQDPNAKPNSKFGKLVTNNNINTKVNGGPVPTQTVNSNFLAIWGNYGTAVPSRESPYTPPDNCGDVGTTQIIATANCRMKVFNKPVGGAALTTATGTSTGVLPSVLNVDLNVFFTNSGLGINSISDPHVRYDRLTGRWFIVAIEVNHKTNNYCCIAVSNTSLASPSLTSASTFNLYYFNMTATGGSSSDFFDYPTLGVDKNYLYIGGNMFANQSTFSGCNMWVVNKANLISTTPSLTVTGFPHSTTNKTDIYTPQGVHNDDPGATEGYFVGASQTYYSKLNIKRVIYGATPTLSNDIALATLAMYTPKTVPTLGGTAIDGGDRRLFAAMIKKNKITNTANLWIAQGTLLNSSGVGGSGGDRDGALWMEIGNLTTTPTILQSATLYDNVNQSSSTAVYYTYPTIALSGQGHSVMGFTSAGPAKYAQAAAAGRYRTDPAASFQSPVDFTNTSSSYNPGANRWGDFTQTVVDPTDDMTMWTFSEYACYTNAWGVRAAQFKAPPPATPVLASTPACGTTTTITINGTSTNNSEFFDPGDDLAAGGPGFNRLKVDVSGPSTAVTVSNVVFVNPTQITASFNVPADAASGTYTVTVTNPDGQTSTTTFDLNCAPAVCGDPTGLTSSNITNTTATVSWGSVSGATSYSVDYEITGSGNWVAAATATTSTSVNFSGLTANTPYDWRVKTNCGTNYVTAQFTTTNTPCNAPTGLGFSAVTSNSATLNWDIVNGITYDLQYRISPSGSWTLLQNVSAPVTISGLTPSTPYDWQVISNCGTNGNSAYSVTQTFTTAVVVNCPDQYEPNNSISTAKNIPVGTNINAQIATSTDKDYYAFNNTSSQRRIKVTLTNLPADYDMKLYRNNSLLGTSANRGTTAETIIYNTNATGTYKVYVYGFNGAFNNTQCYTLNVQLGATNFTAANGVIINDDNIAQTVKTGMKVYPVPASNVITVSFDAYAKGYADIIILNQLGQQVYYNKVGVNDGTNFSNINVSLFRSGVYTLKINNGKEIQTRKVIISR